MNKIFNDYLEKIGEVGEVSEVFPSLVYATGLPKLKPDELVVFEDGQLGQTVGISQAKAEILILSHDAIRVGQKIARTDEFLSVKVGEAILGRVVDSLGRPLDGKELSDGTVCRVDVTPPPLKDRRLVANPLETGVSIVDILIPIGKGQRELVIGDRKTGKTGFFVKTMINQALKGNICIYASIGKKVIEIREMLDSLKSPEARKNIVVVATSASDAAGLIFVTPYTAMAIAEYFKDKGRDVVIILDDLTNHALYYREISLLARRFPGRSSYPGDIFYIHSKLLERAGSFAKGSITAFPVAESIMGDISGYIQTNLMSITDGHVFFDTELANVGRRPAINPFLSVTRVGQQAQTNLVRELSHELSAFLVALERLRDFEHFGAELSEEIIQKLKLGERILNFFDQPREVMPLNVSILIMSMLWIGSWRDQDPEYARTKWGKMADDYNANGTFRKSIDGLVSKTSSFKDFLNRLRESNYGQESYY